MSGFELAAYGPEHKDDYLGLLREAWGPGSMSRDEFEWWFERNPAGFADARAVRRLDVVEEANRLTAAGRPVERAGRPLGRGRLKFLRFDLSDRFDERRRRSERPRSTTLSRSFAAPW